MSFVNKQIESFIYKGVEWQVGQSLYALNADYPPYVFLDIKIKYLHWAGDVDEKTGAEQWKYYMITYDLEYDGRCFKNQRAFISDHDVHGGSNKDVPSTYVTEIEKDEFFGPSETIYGMFFIHYDKEQIKDAVVKYLKKKVSSQEYIISDCESKISDCRDKIEEYITKINKIKET